MPGVPVVEEHAPGDFCWMELATTDQTAAKEFYRGLFAWSFSEFPTGPNEFYTMFKVDGREVGAAYTLRAEQQMQGVPAHWNLYVAFSRPRFATRRHRLIGKFIYRWPIARPSPPKPKILVRNCSCRPCRSKISAGWPCWPIPKALDSRSSKPHPNKLASAVLLARCLPAPGDRRQPAKGKRFPEMPFFSAG